MLKQEIRVQKNKFQKHLVQSIKNDLANFQTQRMKDAKNVI